MKPVFVTLLLAACETHTLFPSLELNSLKKKLKTAQLDRHKIVLLLYKNNSHWLLELHNGLLLQHGVQCFLKSEENGQRNSGPKKKISTREMLAIQLIHVLFTEGSP